MRGSSRVGDVYAYGVVSSSTLYRIKGSFPEAEGYAEIDSIRYMVGGEAANSSIVLARLGASVSLDGNWIGADDPGARTKAFLDDYGIDTSRLPLREDYAGVSETVIAAGGTRTILGTYVRLNENEDWNAPDEQAIRNARVLCLDPFFKTASARAAELAFQAGIPVVTIDCRYDEALVPHAAALVIAESFVRENYPDEPLERLFDEYRKRCPGLVVFTFGERALWYASPGDTLTTFDPYSIDPVDTTGGGDSFRAGVVYGFLQGWDHDRTIDFAAAVSALVCMRSPGVLDAPTLDEVEAFQRERRNRQFTPPAPG